MAAKPPKASNGPAAAAAARCACGFARLLLGFGRGSKARPFPLLCLGPGLSGCVAADELQHAHGIVKPRQITKQCKGKTIPAYVPAGRTAGGLGRLISFEVVQRVCRRHDFRVRAAMAKQQRHCTGLPLSNSSKSACGEEPSGSLLGILCCLFSDTAAWQL